VDTPANAARIRYHLPPTLASKTVSLLTSRELQRLRDSLATKIKPASVGRLFEGSRRRSILPPLTTQAWGKLTGAISPLSSRNRSGRRLSGGANRSRQAAKRIFSLMPPIKACGDGSS
jgi:hypothetical protein